MYTLKVFITSYVKRLLNEPASGRALRVHQSKSTLKKFLCSIRLPLCDQGRFCSLLGRMVKKSYQENQDNRNHESGQEEVRPGERYAAEGREANTSADPARLRLNNAWNADFNTRWSLDETPFRRGRGEIFPFLARSHQNKEKCHVSSHRAESERSCRSRCLRDCITAHKKPCTRRNRLSLQKRP